MRGRGSVLRVMFIYEALSNHQKEAIDREIREGLEKVIISNGSFDYSDKQFTSVIYDLILFNKVINKLLGDNSPPYFSLKEIVIKSRAYKIAYELEHGRPSLEMIQKYIELRKLLLVEPSMEALFNSEYTEEVKCAFEHRIERKKSIEISEEIVDNFESNVYNISSNIKSFESLVQPFYDLRKDLSV